MSIASSTQSTTPIQSPQLPTIWQNIPFKIRKCQDGGEHRGNLEIVTWDSVSELGEPMGWGACLKEESEDLKQKFEVEMKGDFKNFYDYWPQGYRWTCCGLPGGYEWGCDSHFPGECKCDNCRYGYKLPKGFLEERNKSAHAKGLTLGEGNINGKEFH
ncbi:uncharacterized protein LY89DRAFT_679990 [Mollisia scopiformis]|uniref:Uncharacterized protein n=1 Tax=Mollisia scopiformis TaxID=149040 RepID=A0A194XSB6_MOLSC|nr:uncharacterized protein LY89DRAFT_679990 [Mollisia scopiformis]KUJ23195.1 hypothetical protein LY89DRAFT_679990 [Mollisia scopiformis]